METTKFIYTRPETSELFIETEPICVSDTTGNIDPWNPGDSHIF